MLAQDLINDMVYIKGYEKCYMINNDGLIFICVTFRFMKKSLTNKTIILTKNSVKTEFIINDLVGLAFGK